MGALDMKLIFSNPEKTYWSGDTVSGRLVIQSRESILLRNITLKFQGKAKTNWSENDDNYCAVQKYFKNYVILYGGKKHNEELPAGEHCFTFQMVLPPNLPSSFKGRSGYVRYKVKANIDRPQWPDNHIIEELRVISSINLNSNAEYKYPLTEETNKTFCCCCCKSGPLAIVSKINRRGFVPGDILSFVVEIDNISNVEINSVSYEFQRVMVCYTAKRKTSTTEVKALLKEVLGGPIRPNNSHVWQHKIKIPEISPPSYLNMCDIIDLEYRLQIKARPVGAHLDLVNNMPIVIGTMPFVEDTVLS